MTMFASFWKHLLYLRISLGLCIFMLGYPIIFFLRDTVKIAPGSSIFTAICLAAGLVLMIPGSFLQKFYKMNLSILYSFMGWLAVSLFYFIFYNDFLLDPKYDVLREYMNFALVGSFLIILLNVPDGIDKYFIPVLVLFTFVGNFGLFYSLITNPFYVLGERASIHFDGADSGNPHVFARNGFAGVVASVMLLQYRQKFLKILAIACLITSFIAIILTQVRTILLCLLLCGFIYSYFNLTKEKLGVIIAKIFSIQGIIVLLLLFLGLIFLIQRNQNQFDVLAMYWDLFMNRTAGSLNTVIYENTGNDDLVDASSAQRMRSLRFFWWTLEGNPASLIFGNGYRWLYMDFPILEAMIDCGILGIYFFGRTIWTIFKASLQAWRTNYSLMTVLSAYLFLPNLISTISSGQPFDTPYLYSFAFMARFMVFPAIESVKKPAQLAHENS